MRGTNAVTGKSLADDDHLRQSITDILTTPVGSRVLLRDYGSRIFSLIDAPLNALTKLDLYVATIEALLIWEPRILPIIVNSSADESGRVTLSLTYRKRDSGIISTINGIVIRPA